MTLEISERFVGDVLILDLSGRITLGEGARMLRDCIERTVADGKRKILLNVAQVHYVDSSGVCELAKAAIEPRRHGGSLKLLSPTKKVRDLLQITKLYTIFDVYEDESKALKSFSGPELYCCCPLCGYASGPPALGGGFITWPPQLCRNARCEAKFTTYSSQSENQARVESVRIQTYRDEYFELLAGSPFTLKIVGRLDLFSSPALKKAWQAIPLPRRVLFDLSGTTEIDDAGREALVDLLAKRENDARAVVSLESLGSQQVSTFPSGSYFYQTRTTALAALGDVSDAPQLQVRVFSE